MYEYAVNELDVFVLCGIEREVDERDHQERVEAEFVDK